MPDMLYGSEATLADLYILHELLGFEFVVENGVITDVSCF